MTKRNNLIFDQKPLKIKPNDLVLTLFAATGFFLFSFLAHTLFTHEPLSHYLFKKVSAHQIAGYLCSTIHATFITIASSLYLGGKISIHHWKKSLICTKGYLIAEFIIFVLYGDDVEYLMYLHHFLFFFLVVFYENSAPGYLAQGVLAEVTATPLNLIMYLKAIEYPQDSMVFLGLATILLVLFLLFRIVNFTHIAYKIFTIYPLYYFLFFLPILLMNYYWFYLLCQHVLAAL